MKGGGLLLRKTVFSGIIICYLFSSLAAEAEKRGYDSSHLDAALYHYDTLHANQLHIKPHPLPHVHEVSFHALDRHFRLQLKPDRRTLTPDFRVYSVDRHGRMRPHEVDANNFLYGHIQDVPKSHVVAHLSDDGILSAIMTTPTSSYHVEPSSHYVKSPHDFHMIVYDHTHIRPRLNNTKMDFVYPYSQPDGLRKHRQGAGLVPPVMSDHRVKRQSQGRINGRFCGMSLVADHTVYQQFGRSVGSVSRQLVLIVSTVSSMTYTPTNWILDIRGNNVSDLGLTISQVIVHEEANPSPTHYNTARNDVDATDLLNFMRIEEMWSGHCLVHLFTNRRFASGLLGLANIASSARSQTGGICSTRFRDSSGDLVIYNTGLSNFQNGGETMVVSEMVRVVGHEVGHNWGSFHDPSDVRECESFIMNEYAQDGNRPSHFDFSVCSRRAIGAVLASKASCFGDASDMVMCGNYRVEQNEECDAGPQGDVCCSSSCQLQAGAVCSDSNYECCTNCQMANTTVVCRSAPAVTVDCDGDTFCNGRDLTCPNFPVPVNEGTPCVNGMCRVVNSSSMSGSGPVRTECVPVCSVFCQCQGLDECKVCCEDSGSCAPANESINLASGSQCSQGICLNGACSARTQDNIAIIWDIITSLDVNALRVLMMENIVGVVLIFSIPVWALLSWCVHMLIDRPLLKRFLMATRQIDLGRWVTKATKSRKELKQQQKKRQPDQRSLLDGVQEESDEDDEEEEAESKRHNVVAPLDDATSPSSIPRTYL